MTLKVSEKAPLFDAILDSGKKFSLVDQIGKSNIVLYFYPKDFTTGCTKEACTFRDNWEKIVALGATVIGVSSDTPETHSEFKKEHNLPFILLSDEKQEIRKKYGATGLLLPPRVTFVIDKAGVVRYVFNSQLNVTKHVEEALKTLETIESPAA